VAITTRRSELLARLRRVLSEDLVNAAVGRCATALGTSTRSLQRELGRLDTSFRRELMRARLAAAETLLVHSGMKIDAVAAQTGFGSGSHLCMVLRHELGVAPNDLRERGRAIKSATSSSSAP
jgi:transcriptional regulator GlxA family with amidase domain